MKASTKIMSSAKATTRHAVKAIIGDVNPETELTGLVNGAIGSHVAQLNSPIACSCTLTNQRRCFFIPRLIPILSTTAMFRSLHKIGLIRKMQLAVVSYTKILHFLF